MTVDPGKMKISPLLWLQGGFKGEGGGVKISDTPPKDL